VSGAWWRLLPDLTRREISSRLINSSSGWLWLVVTPLLLLSVYGFVFGVIFNARVPEGLEMPFIAWLAVALWPWLAFGESLLKGSNAILQHASLISKVALPRELLVLSSQSAVFILHLFGYAVVLAAIQLLGTDLTWYGLPYVVLVLLTLYLFALGLGLMLSALQVYVRDLEQVLPTLIMFWFFMTPILYAPQILPPEMARWLRFNPMSWWMEEIRAGLFLGKWLPDWIFLALLGGALLTLWLGHRLFRRLSGNFEDFL
jgi:lipopolysaccharide transport system permease protein